MKNIIVEFLFLAIIISLILITFFGNFILILFIKNYLDRLKIKYDYRNSFLEHLSSLVSKEFKVDTFLEGYGTGHGIGTTLVISSNFRKKYHGQVIIKRKFFKTIKKNILETKNLSLKFMPRPWIYDNDLKKTSPWPLNKKYVLKSNKSVFINKDTQEDILKLKPDSIEIYDDNIIVTFHKIIPFISKNKFTKIINLIKRGVINTK